MKALIDKRQFLAAVVCPTRGWFEARKPRESAPPGLAWKFFTGAEVGRIAREQLGRGVELPTGSGVETAEATARAIAGGDATLLFEATFVAGAFVARADALRRDEDGWDLIEVKSSKLSAQDGPSDEALDDLAYTTFVARAAGVRLRRLCLMLISSDYRMGDDGDLLVEVDVTQAALARADEWSALAPVVTESVRSVGQPPPVLKLVCRSCEFFRTTCLGANVPDSILLLPRLSSKRFEPLKQFVRIGALPLDAELTPPQARVARVIRSGTPERDPVGLTRLDQVAWPVYYLDFESINPGLPWFPATPPYEAIPFQYSLHARTTMIDDPIHSEYLAPLGEDWRRALAVRLLGQLGDRGSVITYSGYEKRMLRYLAQAVPDLGPRLDQVIERLFDLEQVVREGYCHPAFQGHTSIKYVLPALAPELRYDVLEIGGGDDAAGAFALMWVGAWGPERHEATRRHLLEYCKLDTLAMVRVHEELVKLWRELKTES